MAVSWAITHCFGVPTPFLGLVTPGTRFQGDTKNSSFSRFMTVLWAIPHCFGVPTPFIGPLTLGTWFKGQYKKLDIFTFYGGFHRLIHTVLGSRRYL
jgi:hypothetical protein